MIRSELPARVSHHYQTNAPFCNQEMGEGIASVTMHLSRGCPSELRCGIKIDAERTGQAQSRDITTLQSGQLGERHAVADAGLHSGRPPPSESVGTTSERSQTPAYSFGDSIPRVSARFWSFKSPLRPKAARSRSGSQCALEQ